MSQKITRRKKVLSVIIGIFIMLGISFFYFNLLTDYARRVVWTEMSLNLNRLNIDIFKKINGRYPNSLIEMKQYAERNPRTDLHKRQFKEFLSDKCGNTVEFSILHGKGGWYYNKTNGEVKVNLTKPVKHYLKFYFGNRNNEIPSNW